MPPARSPAWRSSRWQRRLIVNEAGDRVSGQRLLGLGTRFREESGAFLAALTPPGYYLSLDPAPPHDALRPVYDEGYALDREAAIEVLWTRLGSRLRPAEGDGAAPR